MNHSRARVAACRTAFALFCVATAPGLTAQTPANPIQLPASGRVLQSGSVSTTQSTVNAGGQNSVNLIDSSVNIHGTYQGSVPTGTATNIYCVLSSMTKHLAVLIANSIFVTIAHTNLETPFSWNISNNTTVHSSVSCRP